VVRDSFRRAHKSLPSCDVALSNRVEHWNELFCKNMHNAVARTQSCSNLLTRSEKRGLRKEGLRGYKRLESTGIRNDLL